MAFDSMPQGEMPEAPEPMENEAQEAPEENSLPLALLGGRNVMPGEKLTFTVATVDPDSGTFSVSFKTNKPMGSGVAKSAAAFDEADEASITA